MRVGFTTTVPVEAVFAGGHTPVDLNNIFINSPDPAGFIERANLAGFPRSSCAWIRALHTAVLEERAVDAVIAVTTGDCSNTEALTELLEDGGVKVFRFAYPEENRSQSAYNTLKKNIAGLCAFLGAEEEGLLQALKLLAPAREKLKRVDELTALGLVSGGENHRFLVASGDFEGDPQAFTSRLGAFLREAELRKPKELTRLGFIGVPPIISDLYERVERAGGMVVFNEVQRQFSIPSVDSDYYRRYLNYTYPYDVFSRIADIKANVESRGIKGLIHYVQSFCHRQIQDILLKKHLPVPILTIEGDTPGALDERSVIRLESFIEMLHKKAGAFIV